MQKDQNKRSLLIAREGVQLGMLSELEVRELLATGFLRPTDVYRRAEEPQWKRLTELEREAGQRADVYRIIKRTSSRIFSATEGMADKAGTLTAQVKSFVLANKSALTAGSRRVLEDYLVEIRRLTAEQVIARPAVVVRSALRNDEWMRIVFGAVHDCLPKPIRRFIPESVFIEFCLRNRARLFDSRSGEHSKAGPSPPPNETDKPNQ